MSRKEGPVKTANIFAAVRSKEQVETLSKLGVGLVKVDLLDKKSVEDAVVDNESESTHLHTLRRFC